MTKKKQTPKTDEAPAAEEPEVTLEPETDADDGAPVDPGPADVEAIKEPEWTPLEAIRSALAEYGMPHAQIRGWEELTESRQVAFTLDLGNRRQRVVVGVSSLAEARNTIQALADSLGFQPLP